MISSPLRIDYNRADTTVYCFATPTLGNIFKRVAVHSYFMGLKGFLPAVASGAIRSTYGKNVRQYVRLPVTISSCGHWYLGDIYGMLQTFGHSYDCKCHASISSEGYLKQLMVFVGKLQYNTYFRLKQGCLWQHNIRLDLENTLMNICCIATAGSWRAFPCSYLTWLKAEACTLYDSSLS